MLFFLLAFSAGVLASSYVDAPPDSFSMKRRAEREEEGELLPPRFSRTRAVGAVSVLLLDTERGLISRKANHFVHKKSHKKKSKLCIV